MSAGHLPAPDHCRPCTARVCIPLQGDVGVGWGERFPGRCWDPACGCCCRWPGYEEQCDDMAQMEHGWWQFRSVRGKDLLMRFWQQSPRFCSCTDPIDIIDPMSTCTHCATPVPLMQSRELLAMQLAVGKPEEASPAAAAEKQTKTNAVCQPHRRLH
jgi:hypothetical protein